MSLLGPKYPPQLDAVRLQLEELENRVVDGARLFLREWAATSVRGCIGEIAEFTAPSNHGLRTKKELDGAERLVERFRKLEAILRRMDEEEFSSLQEELRNGAYDADRYERVLRELPKYAHDVYTRKLLGIDWVPQQELERGAEMVYYEASSVAATLEVLSVLGPNDVLYDLGCGLAQVVMMAAWLTDVKNAKGVEFEPAYCRVARARIDFFGWDHAHVVEGDAKDVDYSDGTVFYFFHPFEGEILQAVLRKLEDRSRSTPIRICARGACRHWFKDIDWMRFDSEFESGVRLFVAGEEAG